MIAALSIRSADRRAGSLAFIAAVMSVLTLSRKFINLRRVRKDPPYVSPGPVGRVLLDPASVILIRIPVGDVPAVCLLVEAVRHLHGVDLDVHLERRLDVEIAVAA